MDSFSEMLHNPREKEEGPSMMKHNDTYWVKVDLDPVTDILLKQREFGEAQKADSPLKMEVGTRAMPLQTKERQGPLAPTSSSRERKTPSPGPSERAWLCQDLNFRLLPSTVVREYTWVALSPNQVRMTYIPGSEPPPQASSSSPTHLPLACCAPGCLSRADRQWSSLSHYTQLLVSREHVTFVFPFSNPRISVKYIPSLERNEITCSSCDIWGPRARVSLF